MKIFRLVIALLLLASPAYAQTCQVGQTCSGNITAQSTDCSTSGSCVSLPLPNNTGTVVLNITGTYSGTILFEQSADGGASWVAASGNPQPSGAVATSTTSTGMWRFVASGLTNFRVRCSAYSSGKAGIGIQASAASASMALVPPTPVTFTWQTPSTADSGKWQAAFSRDVNIIRIYCNTDGLGTVSINLEIRPEDQPNATGTTVLAAPVTCTGTTANTSTFANSEIPGSAVFFYLITPIVTGTTGSPGKVTVAVETE